MQLVVMQLTITAFHLFFGLQFLSLKSRVCPFLYKPLIGAVYVELFNDLCSLYFSLSN